MLSEHVILLPMPDIPPANAKRKLRWYQFSLRTLLIVVTLFALACSWFAVKMREAERQKQAKQAILEIGGDVRYDFEFDSAGEETDADGPSGPAWLIQLLGEDFFKNVVAVEIPADHLDKEMLSQLLMMPRLKAVQLQCKFTRDSDLTLLNELPQLRKVTFYHAQMMDSELAELKGLKQVEVLEFHNVSISDAGLKHLKGLSNLKEFHYSYTDITAKGIQDLQKALPNLKIQRKYLQ